MKAGFETGLAQNRKKESFALLLQQPGRLRAQICVSPMKKKQALPSRSCPGESEGKTGSQSQKEHKPETSAIDLAAAIGIELLTEEEYRALQQLEAFDTKTPS